MSTQAQHPPLPTLDQIKVDLATAEADIEAGRVVPGEVVMARAQAALDHYSALPPHVIPGLVPGTHVGPLHILLQAKAAADRRG